ncbi:MAG: antibiotic biosynthesis monooxygenase [Planctomycetales bacterium]|nr:antibiotic biosynthesis monooxygenase [Planctomycetales bacterium]
MIYVIATIQLHPGKRPEFLKAFHALVPQVVAEKGCLSYEPTVDADVDMSVVGERRDDVVTVVEKWESIDALQDHLMAPHMMEYRAQVKDLVAGVSLRILEPAK